MSMEKCIRKSDKDTWHDGAIMIHNDVILELSLDLEQLMFREEDGSRMIMQTR